MMACLISSILSGRVALQLCKVHALSRGPLSRYEKKHTVAAFSTAPAEVAHKGFLLTTCVWRKALACHHMPDRALCACRKWQRHC